MKIKEISLSKSAKFGKFNKYQTQVGITIETDNKDDIQELWNWINHQLATQMEAEVDDEWLLSQDDKKTIKNLQKSF